MWRVTRCHAPESVWHNYIIVFPSVPYIRQSCWQYPANFVVFIDNLNHFLPNVTHMCKQRGNNWHQLCLTTRDLFYLLNLHGIQIMGNSLHVKYTLQWRHNGYDSVSKHQRLYCLLNRFYGRRSKKNQSSASLAFVRDRWIPRTTGQ